MESTLCWPGQLSEKDVLVGEQSSGFGNQVCDLIQFFGLITVFFFFNLASGRNPPNPAI